MRLFRHLITMFSLNEFHQRSFQRYYAVPHQVPSLFAAVQTTKEVIDVRSPSEFEIDHYPGAINLPVLNDEERHQIGCLYKEDSFVAKKKGAGMVARNIGLHLDQYLQSKPGSYKPLVYCWRGGSRSNAMAIVLAQVGWQVEVLTGGYKRYRAEVRNLLQEQSPKLKLRVLGGLTGVGKTALLHHIKSQGHQVIDLEHLAGHRGSALGKFPNDAAQPSQRLFESILTSEMMSLDLEKPIWIEAESSKVGAVSIPKELWQNMKSSPRVTVTLPISQRIQRIRQEYRYWVEHPTDLREVLIEYSEKFNKNVVDDWLRLIEQERWDQLVTSLLGHYDSSYGHKPTHQIHEIALLSHTKEDLVKFLDAIAVIE